MTRRGRGRPPHPDILTPGEWRVLDEVRTGATNAEIAVRLGLSPATVKFHIRNIRGKLGLSDREEMAAWRREPEPVAPSAGSRWLLAPLGLLLGFWKPAVAVAAVTIVGGGAIAAGVFAYTLVNDGEASPLPDSPLATASPTPPATSAPEATATPAATPVPTPTPAATPTATPTVTGEVELPDGLSLTFWGDVSDEQQDAVQERVTEVVRFYDARFGVRVPNLDIHIAAGEAALSAALGRPLDNETRLHPALYEEGSMFVHAETRVDWIERFYFEAFQELVAQGQGRGPAWLSEGAVMYMGHLFRDWRGDASLAGNRSHWQIVSSADNTPLEDLEGWSSTHRWPDPRKIATLAVDWLVAQAGEDALVEYYRALPDSGGWQEAFEETFGFSVQDAYEGFATYREGVVAAHPAISGHVRGPNGTPLSATSLFVNAFYLDGSGSSGSSVQGGGSFTLRAADRAYRLEVTMHCPGWSGTLGWYEEASGFTTDESEATIFTPDGEDIRGVVIRLPAQPEELVDGCGEES